MAPLTPFLTEYIWGILRADSWPDSVHLAAWPVPDHGLIDARLSEQMGLARRLVELGRSARASAAVRIRQPLSLAVVDAAGFAGLPADLRAQVAEELNVRALEPLEAVGDQLVDYTVKPNFRSLGKRFGNGTPAVAAAIGSAVAASLAEQLRAGPTASIMVESTPVDLGPDDVIVTQLPASGWAVASDSGETVALNVTMTPELRREGLAREVVRLVQDARKSDGLDVSDRIWLRWRTSDSELTAALAEHAALISTEVLAVDYRPLTPGAQAEGAREHVDEVLALTFWIRRAPDAAGQPPAAQPR